MSSLDVLLHGELAGQLERGDQGRLGFTYGPGWLAEGTPLSLSLPLRAEPFADEECRGFFAGLLPEGGFLRAVAAAFGVSASNPFAVLTEIGGECAGAVSLVAPGAPAPAPGEPVWLEAAEIPDLLDRLPSRPLLAGSEEGLRLSLAGAQNKLPVIFAGGRLGIPRGVPPSTHIIKIPSPGFEGLVANEAFCLALAREAGLEVVEAIGRTFPRKVFEDSPDDPECLQVERYDRGETRDGRIHQEDLCQGLGMVPEMKYESEGGPSAARCAAHIRRHCAAPAVDILRFADALIFNVVIGNCDAHAKNYSLILEGENTPRLAPLYDLLSTSVYPGLSRKLAMKLGGEYRPPYIRARHLDRLAADLELARPALRRRVAELTERITSGLDAARDSLGDPFAGHPVIDAVLEQIDTAAGAMRDTARQAYG